MTEGRNEGNKKRRKDTYGIYPVRDTPISVFLSSLSVFLGVFWPSRHKFLTVKKTFCVQNRDFGLSQNARLKEVAKGIKWRTQQHRPAAAGSGRGMTILSIPTIGALLVVVAAVAAVAAGEEVIIKMAEAAADIEPKITHVGQ
ncbi:MAG: hypothetical protein GY874_08910 [Desulfobacteraceae bacterium]|nr:hypothetical protein [Desulfobacteraceae bacterium]